TDDFRQGDKRAAVQGFDAAATEFAAADGNLRMAWTLDAIPVAGQNIAALRTVIQSGYRLARTGSDAVAEAPYDELRSATGQIDIARPRSMDPPSQATATALRQAKAAVDGTASPWLLPTV